MKVWANVITAICHCGAAIAGVADVNAVTASAGGNNNFTFHVTVKHADTGWDHYADKWDIVGLSGPVCRIIPIWWNNPSPDP